MTNDDTFSADWSRALEGIGNDFRNALVKAAPVDNGRLKGSIAYSVKGDLIQIEMVDYALYVEFGTAPHIIKPKNKKALKFNVGGKAVFATVVHHPGTTAQPFIRNTIHNQLSGIIAENIGRQFT